MNDSLELKLTHYVRQFPYEEGEALGVIDIVINGKVCGNIKVTGDEAAVINHVLKTSNTNVVKIIPLGELKDENPTV